MKRMACTGAVGIKLDVVFGDLFLVSLQTDTILQKEVVRKGSLGALLQNLLSVLKTKFLTK